MSEGVKTGVSVYPDHLYLQENGDIDKTDAEPNITITLHTPLKCDHQHSCSIKINLRIVSNCKYLISLKFVVKLTIFSRYRIAEISRRCIIKMPRDFGVTKHVFVWNL